ncbi:hypothetical protein [Bdellovibrio sp. HCB337]|uniref:hypothetical protein n=1 Tax=Bdellovibrio sp. HCB337 TaxID=3394358 RepID=UPI0039A44962
MNTNFRLRFLQKTCAPLALFLISHSAMATDWNQLIAVAPTLTTERVSLDTNGLVSADVAKLPNGKYRLIEFQSFSARLKPVLAIAVPKGLKLEELCTIDTFFDKRNAFNAKLTFTVNPALANEGSLLANSGISFENVFTLVPQIYISKYGFHFSATVPGVPHGQQKMGEYFSEFLQSHALKTKDGTVTIDLSEMNGFACDLMNGSVSFVVSGKLTYEAGLPKVSDWLGAELYEYIFLSYWKSQPSFVKTVTATDTHTEDEAFNLGISSGLPREVSGYILNTPEKLQKLMKSLKKDLESVTPEQKAQLKFDDLQNNWSMTLLYSAPKDLQQSQSLKISVDPVVVVPMKKEKQ